MNSVAASASAAGAPPAHAGGGAVPAPPVPPGGPSRRRGPEDTADYVTVSDPVLHADGMNKYTSYRVDCRPPLRDPAADAAAAADPGACHDAFGLHNPGQFSSVLRRYRFVHHARHFTTPLATHIYIMDGFTNGLLTMLVTWPSLM